MIEIKNVKENELESAFQLIWNVFKEFVAPDYQERGIKTFYEKFIENNEFRAKFKEGREIMYGAYVEGELKGVLSVGRSHISCVFVDGKYHRRGIGRKLFQTVIEELKTNGIKEIKLNASPYAVEFYRRLGFKDIGERSEYEGIVYTPMKMLL